jgi:hypothetical protein
MSKTTYNSRDSDKKYTNEDTDIEEVVRSPVSARDRVFGTPELLFMILDNIVHDVHIGFEQRLLMNEYGGVVPELERMHSSDAELKNDMTKLQQLPLVCKTWNYILLHRAETALPNGSIRMSHPLNDRNLYTHITTIAKEVLYCNWILFDTVQDDWYIKNGNENRLNFWGGHHFIRWMRKWQMHPWLFRKVHGLIKEIIEASIAEKNAKSPKGKKRSFDEFQKER